MRKFLLLLVVFPFLTACGFEVVDTGYRGVKTRFGEVDMKAGSLPEGFYTYNPLTSNIIEMEVRTSKLEKTTNTYTKDVQQADITFVAQYNLKTDAAHVMFRDVGRDWDEKILLPILEGSLKQTIGKWDAVDLIANRKRATDEALSEAAKALLERNIILTKLEMVNIQYQPEFEKAVEDKVRAIQRAIEEQNRTVQITEQAKQKVIDAKATAESMRIRANALQQNAKLVEYEWVQKWDGKTPQIVMGAGSNPLLMLPSK